MSQRGSAARQCLVLGLTAPQSCSLLPHGMASQGAFRDIRGNEPSLAKVQRLRKAASPALGPENAGNSGISR